MSKQETNGPRWGGRERMKMGENGSKLDARKTSCYKILPRKYVKAQSV